MNIPAVLISFAFMIVPQLLFAGEPGPETLILTALRSFTLPAGPIRPNRPAYWTAGDPL